MSNTNPHPAMTRPVQFFKFPCALATYSPEELDEIPLDRQQLAMKIILRSSRLFDAIIELEATNPTRLSVSAGATAPYFILSSAGPLGSTSVEFSRDPNLLETFEVPRRVRNTYRYGLVRLAAKTMAFASKVSVRTDWQGVMSLQFLVELDGGYISFIDFRFLPLVGEDWDVEGSDEGLEDEDEDEDRKMT
jgi:cell cycle checkpoint protein